MHSSGAFLLGAAVLGVAGLGAPLAAQTTAALWDEVEADLPAAAEPEAEPEAEAAARDTAFSLSLHGYGAYALHSQDDLRFARRGKGVEEAGLALTLGYDSRLTDSLRLKVDLVAEFDHSRSVAAGRRERLRFGEAFLHADLSDAVWLRAGNLKIPFGTSDAFPILDVFNPRYDHLWGIDQPDGNAIPSPAVQLVGNFGAFRTQLSIGAGFEPDQVAYAGMDHDYLIRDRAGTVISEGQGPAGGYRPEWVASLAWFGEGLDLSVMAGEVYEKSPVLQGVGVGPGGLQLQTTHPRLEFAGLSGAKTMGAWLIRADLGHFRGARYFNQGFYAAPATAPGSFETDVTRGVLGLEYAGLPNTVLSVELSQTRIHDWQPGMREDRDVTSAAANARFNLMDDRLDLEFTMAMLANGDATVLRATADFAVSDQDALSVQWVDYRSNSLGGFMEPYEDADRLYVGWKRSF